MFSDRIPIREELPSLRSVYHNYRRRSADISFVKGSTVDDWDLHCAEVVRTDDLEVSVGLLRFSVYSQLCLNPPPKHRRLSDDASQSDARNRLDALKHLSVKFN